MKKTRQGRERQMAKQRQQAKRRQRTAARSPSLLPIQPQSETEGQWVCQTVEKDDWMQGMVRYANILMYTNRPHEAEQLLRHIERQAPLLHQHLRVYRAGIRILDGDCSGQVWQDLRHLYLCELRKYPQPLWDGSPQPGRTLLVFDSLAGYGDTLQTGPLLAPAK
jgi:hypothetical protein